MEYRGPVVYRNRKIDMVLFSGGYATIGTDKSVTFHYYTQDYLGNNRAVVNGSTGAIEQTTAYYPYGAVIPDISTDNTGQPFKYGGKELVSANGLNMYDFGARLHYPAIPQFDRVDPMCEKFSWLSPYLYCANNPVNAIDPTGEIVVALQVGAQFNIQATLEPEEAEYLRFIDGKVDAEFLNKSESTSANMTVLKAVVNSETIFHVATASEYKRTSGEIRDMVETGGTLGVTMMPGYGGNDTSPDNDVHIFISNYYCPLKIFERR